MPDRGYWREDRGQYPREHTASGRKPGQDQDYGRAMLDDMRRYARGGYDERGGTDYRGLGPRGYRRSDERIREDVSDRLTDDDEVDASDIEVTVSACEVTLNGMVDSRWARRRAEDIAESVRGVREVQNNLRVRPPSVSGTGTSVGASAMAGAFRTPTPVR